jgi:hypothetical protein
VTTARTPGSLARAGHGGGDLGLEGLVVGRQLVGLEDRQERGGEREAPHLVHAALGLGGLEAVDTARGQAPALHQRAPTESATITAEISRIWRCRAASARPRR